MIRGKVPFSPLFSFPEVTGAGRTRPHFLARSAIYFVIARRVAPWQSTYPFCGTIAQIAVDGLPRAFGPRNDDDLEVCGKPGFRRQNMSMKSVLVAILWAFLIPLARAEEELPPACQTLMGSHAVVDLLESPEFEGLAKELIHPDYVVGNPAFHIAIAGNTITATGAVTGNVLQMEFNDSDSSRLDEFLELFGGKVECSLRWKESREMSLTRVDLSASTPEQLHGLREYLAKAWKEQVAVEEFLLYEFSMTGVTGGVFGLPMRHVP
jgi:hypothetical protein